MGLSPFHGDEKSGLSEKLVQNRTRIGQQRWIALNTRSSHDSTLGGAVIVLTVNLTQFRITSEVFFLKNKPTSKKRVSFMAGEMAQQLRAVAAFAEGPG